MPLGKEKGGKETGFAFTGLAVVSTPIGNLGDITPRARDVLSHADLIACEDTRHTGLLLSRLGITPKKLVAYHDHSQDHVIHGLIEALQKGKTVALVSDAGTPLISDPGYRLVAACRQGGIAVTPIPGASALLAGLAASGLPTDQFYFAGFLPHGEKKRRDMLVGLQALRSTIVFYESPKRLASTLAIMADLYPARPAVVARELTKLHESFYHGDVASLYAELKDQTLKGEAVLILGPLKDDETLSEDELKAMVANALADGYSRRDAAALIADQTGHAKKIIYQIAIALPDPSRDHDR